MKKVGVLFSWMCLDWAMAISRNRDHSLKNSSTFFIVKSISINKNALQNKVKNTKNGSQEHLHQFYQFFVFWISLVK